MRNMEQEMKNGRSWGRRGFDCLSGMGLATLLLLLLMLLTWLATLEQVDYGLYATLKKYFDWRSVWVFPEVNGNRLPIVLPGGYWVCALLVVNLFLGGVVRMRKGRGKIGILISHCGILMMIVAGGVAQHWSQRGNMQIEEGQVSDVAEDFVETVVEVGEVKDGKVEKFHVIRGKYLEDLGGAERRSFAFAGLPFELELTRYAANALPMAETERAPTRGEPIVDGGYFLMEMPLSKQVEADNAGCYARVLDSHGNVIVKPFVLARASFYPKTIRVDGRTFVVDMRKRLWKMPFSVRLDRFDAEFYPGTMRPKSFESTVTRLEHGAESQTLIRMNQPMRYEGLTFYQASYGPQGAGPGQKLFSVFEVVSNPGDQWPKYSLYVVTLGLAVHFGVMLVTFIRSRHGKF